jgi:cell division protein FtsL
MTVNNTSKKSIIKILLWPFKSYLRILAVVIFIGIYQYQAIHIDILAREIRSLELKRNQLFNGNTTLQVHIDQLTNINRIEKLAYEKFGLVAPEQKREKIVIKSFNPQKDLQLEEQKERLKLAGVN